VAQVRPGNFVKGGLLNEAGSASTSNGVFPQPASLGTWVHSLATHGAATRTGTEHQAISRYAGVRARPGSLQRFVQREPL